MRCSREAALCTCCPYLEAVVITVTLLCMSIEYFYSRDPVSFWRFLGEAVLAVFLIRVAMAVRDTTIEWNARDERMRRAQVSQ